ncbi:MAG: class I SAM-dependent methyltransferase [Parcubacteria group bacterium]
MAGILNNKYNDNRKRRIDYLYRLNRRTFEARKIIEKHFDKSAYLKLNCLDVGTADGLMLSRLNKFFQFNKAIGIDLSEELIKTNEDSNIELKIGDAENLNFDDNAFDIIIACAVIEHVDDHRKMLRECFRTLKKNGILIITTPNPFHDKIAMKTGYLRESNHVETFTLPRLTALLQTHNFKIVSSKYFMFFPFFKLPFEQRIESLIRFIGLEKIMPNQMIVGEKTNS